MTRRLLAVCLLTYPKTQRQRDGEYLLDLALELAAGSGIGRQAASLIRGGLHSRRRRSRLLAVGAAVLIVVGGGLTAGSAGLAQVEVYACSDARCRDVSNHVDEKQREGWTCARQSTPDASWRCESP